MIRRAICILTVILVLDVLAACNCPDPQLFKYTNSSLLVEHLDNRGQSPVAITGGSALKAAYGIRMTIHCETTVFNTVPVGLLLNRSYATSWECPEPIQYHAKDSIVALRIISLGDFDNDHPAGSDISSAFKLFREQGFVSITDYLEEKPTVFYMEENKNIVLDALLISPPVNDGDYSFRVEIETSDGRQLIQDTSEILLQ